MEKRELSELEIIDVMLAKLRSLKASIKKRNKLSKSQFESNGMTPKRFQQLNASLNWQCMDVDKIKTDIAREFKGSELDVSTDEKIYNPSGFHSYKH